MHEYIDSRVCLYVERCLYSYIYRPISTRVCTQKKYGCMNIHRKIYA